MSEFSSTKPLTISELNKASSIEVLDETGKSVKLGDLYKDQTTILIFIRHFNCGLCMDFLKFLETKIDTKKLEEAKVNLVVIGCGNFKAIKPYRELLNVPYPIYADSKKLTYNALGMTRRTLEMGAEQPEYQRRGIVSNIFMSIKNAFLMGSFDGGDIKALGGEFVIKKTEGGSEVVYTHRMENTRGHGKIEELAAAAGLSI